MEAEAFVRLNRDMYTQSYLEVLFEHTRVMLCGRIVRDGVLELELDREAVAACVPCWTLHADVGSHARIFPTHPLMCSNDLIQ